MTIQTKTLDQLPQVPQSGITPDMGVLTTSPSQGEGRLLIDDLVAALQPPSGTSSGGSYYQPTVIFTKAEW